MCPAPRSTRRPAPLRPAARRAAAPLGAFSGSARCASLGPIYNWLTPALRQAHGELHPEYYRGEDKYGFWESKQADVARASEKAANALSWPRLVEALERQTASGTVRVSSWSAERGEKRSSGPSRTVAERNGYLWNDVAGVKALLSPGADHQSMWPLLRLVLPDDDKARRYHAKEITMAEIYAKLLHLNDNSDRDYLALTYPEHGAYNGHHDAAKGLNQFSDKLQAVLARRVRRTSRNPHVTVGELNGWLDAFSAASSGSSETRMAVAERWFEALTAVEQKWSVV